MLISPILFFNILSNLLYLSARLTVYYPPPPISSNNLANYSQKAQYLGHVAVFSNDWLELLKRLGWLYTAFSLYIHTYSIGHNT